MSYPWVEIIHHSRSGIKFQFLTPILSFIQS